MWHTNYSVLVGEKPAYLFNDIASLGTLGAIFMDRARSEVTEEVSVGLVAITNLVDLQLRVLQRGQYQYIINRLDSATTLQSSARELSGAKALLESIISIGFPQSLDKDDFARALLFGSERVVDTDAVKELCNLGIVRSYDTNQNAKVDIAAILDERVAGLETWVSNRLTQIQTNGYGESLQLVSSTLSRLDAFRTLRQQPSPPPYLGALGARLTNGVASRLFIPWGEPNVRYTVQFSTNLTQWADLPAPADEGEDYFTTPSGRFGFYRTVLRP